MNSLPVQKLSITEFLVAVAVGLMLFLLPNDAKNQFESELVCEGYVFVVSFVIIVIMHFIVKRYEAIGASLFFMAVFNLISLVFGIINGFATKGNDYYLTITESKRRQERDGRFVYDKHKIFLYKEDFQKFADGLQEVVNYIKERCPVVEAVPRDNFSDVKFEEL